MKHSWYGFLALVFLLVPQGLADITLAVGDVSIVLMESRCYTFGNIHRKERLFCEGALSGQGVVLKMDTIEGEWAGSIHGHEILLEAKLTVDGQIAEIEQDQRYHGRCIEFYRRTIIASAVVVQSTVKLTPDRIEETVSLQGISPESECIGCFAFLGSRSNRLTDYAAMNKAGRTLYSGRLIADDNTYSYLKPALAVAQYDPILGDGLAAILAEGESLDPLLYLWDRPSDNKLYPRFYKAQQKCNFENFYAMKMVTRFFDSTPDQWIQTTGRLTAMEFCRPELPADLNHDCRVDLGDLMMMAEAWLSCNLENAEDCPAPAGNHEPE